MEIIDTTTVMEIDFILKEGLDNLENKIQIHPFKIKSCHGT